MPFHHGKFGPAKGSKPGAIKSTGEKPPATSPQEKEHGQSQSPHGAGGGEEHVTKTHPGSTQPHPVTGVHAFHGNHKGGGKYESHTHHDGGEVETRQHPSASDMHSAQQEALPDEQQGQGQDDGSEMGMDMDNLGGIGGGESGIAG